MFTKGLFCNAPPKFPLLDFYLSVAQIFREGQMQTAVRIRIENKIRKIPNGLNESDNIPHKFSVGGIAYGRITAGAYLLNSVP